MTELVKPQPATGVAPPCEKKASLLQKAAEEAVKLLIGAVLGGSIAILTPLKDVIFSLVWKDKPNVEIQVPTQKIFVGDKFDLRVVVLQTNPAPIAAGIVDISGGESILVPPTSQSIQFEKADHALVVPKDDKAIPLQAKVPGPAKLMVKLRRNGGEVVSTAERIVQIEALEDRGYVSAQNLSGVWKLSLGPQEDGQIFMSEPKRGELVGRYVLAGQRGSILGHRDGSGDFDAVLIRSDSPHRWKLQGKWVADGQFVKISGWATQQKPSRDAWVVMPTARVPFKASSTLE